MSLPDVHFYRSYYGSRSKKGMSEGADIVFVKWVMIRAGLMPNPANGIPDDKWNANAVAGAKKLQKLKKITPVSGNMGPATFAALRGMHKKGSKTEYAWDAFRIKGYDRAIDKLKVPSEAEIRQFISDQLYIMYKYRDDIDYTQKRPVWPVIARVKNPANADEIDCSGTAIYGGALADWNFRKEGVRVPPYDPTYGNSGYGNTWSLAKGGRRVVRSESRVGDLVFYNGHVAIIVHRSGDAINMVSMGSQAGPLYLPDTYRSDVQQYRTYDLREVIQ